MLNPRLWLAIAVASGSCLHTSDAAADDEASGTQDTVAVGMPGATEQARLVYERAAQAYAEKRYKDAIDLFQQADGLRPNPAFSFNVGIAYEDMGDSAMALRHYRAYLRKLPQASDRDEVDDRIRRLERVLADKGLQQVTILSDPSSAVVVIDGNPVGVSPWTGELSPGYHAVLLRLSGYEETHRDFDLPPRRAIDVPVSLKRQKRGSDATPIDMSKLAAKREQLELWEHVRPVTWGVLGAGFVSLGVALGFELARSDFDESARLAMLQTERDALDQRAHRQEVWARGFFMLGLGLGVTSIVLGYQDLTDGLRASRPAAAVSVGCGALHTCSAGFSGTF